MLKHLPKVPSLLKATYADWKRENPSFLAAALAYYTFFSLIPLLVIIAAIGNIFFGQAAVTGQLQSTLAKLFGEKVASVIDAALVSTYTSNSDLTLAITAIALIFGASYVFVQLRNALNIIWKVQAKKRLWVEFVEGRLVSLVMITGVSALLLLWIATSASLSTVVLFSESFASYNGFLLEAANFLLLFVITATLFAMMYKLLPSVKLEWEDVGLGALVTAFLFTTGAHLVAFYLTKIGLATLYGVAGSMVVLLVWLYIAAQLFLFGVVFTKVFAARHGSRSKRP